MTSASAHAATAQYSNAPNWIATLASAGEIVTSMIRPKIVPTKEKTTPTPSALPASPFAASGAPSKVVAIEDGVPGMLSRIAATSPPEMPPT